LYLFGAAALVVLIALFIVLRGSFTPAATVETTRASLVYPSQANAVLTASGYVVAQRKAAIASKATGRLVHLGFEEGDRVRKGEIIGRIESADVEAALAQAKATLDLYKAELHDAQRSYERAKTLYANQLVSQAEYDAAKARFDRVTASIAAGEAAVRAAEVQVENTFIRAPFDGTILTKNADVGEVVAPFAAGASSRVAVVTIADMNSLEVEADVSESNIERVSPDQPCEIVLDAYPDHRYRGVVNKIVPTADRAKATVMTKVRFIERDSRVLPEMSAKVLFLSKTTKSAGDESPKLMIVASAVLMEDGKAAAFVVKGDVLEEVALQLGERFGDNVEIRSGLSPNDIVVLKPTDRLESGVKVRVKE
jgi:RND family efflux transporter MFP subunit